MPAKPATPAARDPATALVEKPKVGVQAISGIPEFLYAKRDAVAGAECFAPYRSSVGLRIYLSLVTNLTLIALVLRGDIFI